MAFRIIDDSEWRGCYRLAKEAPEIRENAASLITALQRDFAQQDSTHIGLEIGNIDDSDIATVTCPAGEGRLRLAFMVIGNGLVGRFIVERRNPLLAAEAWESVWAIGIGSNQGEFSHYWQGDDPTARGAKLLIGAAPGSAGGQSLFRLGMCIIFALINGPQTSE